MKTIKKDEFKQYCLDEEIGLTNDLNNACWYQNTTGVMIDGDFCDGIRGLDHNVLGEILGTKDQYEKTQIKYDLIRLIPEYPCIIAPKGLKLDQTIKNFVETNNWQVEYME